MGTRAAALVLLATLSVAAASATAGRQDSAGGCGAAFARSTVADFAAAFDRGDSRQLERVFAPAGLFKWYAVMGAPGKRVGAASQNRRSLLRYFARRHRASERLTLKRFEYRGRSLGRAQFTFELLRQARDLEPAVLYGGKGAVDCFGRRGLSVWVMGPDADR